MPRSISAKRAAAITEKLENSPANGVEVDGVLLTPENIPTLTKDQADKVEAVLAIGDGIVEDAGLAEPTEETPEADTPEVAVEPALKKKPKIKKPSQGSLIRKKRSLLCELRDPATDAARVNEIRATLDGELADVPNLNPHQIAALGD